VAALVAAVAIIAVIWRSAGSSDVVAPSGATSTPASTPGSASTPKVAPRPLPTAMPTQPVRLTAAEKQASSVAGASLRSFIGVSAGALAADNGKADISSAAAGPALGEIQALATQYHHEDMSVSGAPRVLSTRVVSADLGARPPTVSLAVCLDNRPVTVRDAKGRDLGRHRTASELTVLNLYQLQRVAGQWLVVNHSIPAQSSCQRPSSP
jgi:hypothetical protein